MAALRQLIERSGSRSDRAAEVGGPAGRHRSCLLDHCRTESHAKLAVTRAEPTEALDRQLHATRAGLAATRAGPAAARAGPAAARAGPAAARAGPAAAQAGLAAAVKYGARPLQNLKNNIITTHEA